MIELTEFEVFTRWDKFSHANLSETNYSTENWSEPRQEIFLLWLVDLYTYIIEVKVRMNCNRIETMSVFTKGKLCFGPAFALIVCQSQKGTIYVVCTIGNILPEQFCIAIYVVTLIN